MADNVPLIQVDGEDMEVAETGKTINNHTDLEDLTDSEESGDERRVPKVVKNVRKRRVKKSQPAQSSSLLAAAPNDEGSLTDCEQIEVDDEVVQSGGVTLAELPNFYEPLRPQIVEVKDGSDGKVRINKITSGITVQELSGVGAAGLSVAYLDLDPSSEDPLTDVDSLDAASDNEADVEPAEELEKGILNSYDTSGKTSAFSEQSVITIAPGIVIDSSHVTASPQRGQLTVPGSNNEATTDVEELGVSDDEAQSSKRLLPNEQNTAALTDTEEIEMDINEINRARTPEPLVPPNGPLERGVRRERITIEEDEEGRILISADAARDKTPSPYLSVHSDDNDPQTDIENYATSDSDGDHRGFETPDVEMFEGATVNMRDRDVDKIDLPAEDLSDASGEIVNGNRLEVPSSGQQALTDTEDLETSDIEERNITEVQEAQEEKEKPN